MAVFKVDSPQCYALHFKLVFMFVLITSYIKIVYWFAFLYTFLSMNRQYHSFRLKQPHYMIVITSLH